MALIRGDLDAFLADPTIAGLDGILDHTSFVLRVGVLFGAGQVTAGEARRLLAPRTPYGVTALNDLPEHARIGGKS